MTTLSCDLCDTEIQTAKMVDIRVDFYSSAELCHSCGKPITDFMKRKKLLTRSEDKLKGIANRD